MSRQPFVVRQRRKAQRRKRESAKLREWFAGITFVPAEAPETAADRLARMDAAAERIQEKQEVLVESQLQRLDEKHGLGIGAIGRRLRLMAKLIGVEWR